MSRQQRAQKGESSQSEQNTCAAAGQVWDCCTLALSLLLALDTIRAGAGATAAFGGGAGRAASMRLAVHGTVRCRRSAGSVQAGVCVSRQHFAQNGALLQSAHQTCAWSRQMWHQSVSA